VRRLKAALLGLAAALALAAACSGAGKPAAKPKQPDPADQTVEATTKLLNLDAAQQQKMRELLKELGDRYDAIQAEWAKGAKVDPMALKLAQQQFENEFFAILTPEQQRIFRETRIRMTFESRFGSKARS
jgi:Spy/CpxP family protein refolding chaperone